MVMVMVARDVQFVAVQRRITSVKECCTYRIVEAGRKLQAVMDRIGAVEWWYCIPIPIQLGGGSSIGIFQPRDQEIRRSGGDGDCNFT